VCAVPAAEDRLPAAERLVDLLSSAVGLLPAREADFAHRDLHGSRDRLFQRALLVTAAQPGDQLLITGIGQPGDQPPHQVINDKHISGLPASGATRHPL
jgi:hypothetical protein